jgi:hypothetical protein
MIYTNEQLSKMKKADLVALVESIQGKAERVETMGTVKTGRWSGLSSSQYATRPIPPAWVDVVDDRVRNGRPNYCDMVSGYGHGPEWVVVAASDYFDNGIPGVDAIVVCVEGTTYQNEKTGETEYDVYYHGSLFGVAVGEDVAGMMDNPISNRKPSQLGTLQPIDPPIATTVFASASACEPMEGIDGVSIFSHRLSPGSAIEVEAFRVAPHGSELVVVDVVDWSEADGKPSNPLTSWQLTKRTAVKIADALFVAVYGPDQLANPSPKFGSFGLDEPGCRVVYSPATLATDCHNAGEASADVVVVVPAGYAGNKSERVSVTFMRSSSVAPNADPVSFPVRLEMSPDNVQRFASTLLSMSQRPPLTTAEIRERVKRELFS